MRAVAGFADKDMKGVFNNVFFFRPKSYYPGKKHFME